MKSNPTRRRLGAAWVYVAIVLPWIVATCRPSAPGYGSRPRWIILHFALRHWRAR